MCIELPQCRLHSELYVPGVESDVAASDAVVGDWWRQFLSHLTRRQGRGRPTIRKAVLAALRTIDCRGAVLCRCGRLVK